jgi:ABC-type Mn2+/Zn2+ transport system permease subunit
LGILISIILDIPAGAAIILFNFVLFLLAFLLKRI